MVDSTVTISKEEYETLCMTLCRVKILEELYMKRGYISDEDLKIILDFEERKSDDQ